MRRCRRRMGTAARRRREARSSRGVGGAGRAGWQLHGCDGDGVRAWRWLWRSSPPRWPVSRPEPVVSVNPAGAERCRPRSQGSRRAGMLLKTINESVYSAGTYPPRPTCPQPRASGTRTGLTPGPARSACPDEACPGGVAGQSDDPVRRRVCARAPPTPFRSCSGAGTVGSSGERRASALSHLGRAFASRRHGGSARTNPGRRKPAVWAGRRRKQGSMPRLGADCR